MATDRTSRRPAPVPGPVALFIDWDNFAIGLRQEMPDRPPDLGPILRWARRAGTLIVSRAYGEWRDPTERLAIYNAGVEAVYAPVLPLGGSLVARNGAGGAKSLADTAMAVDVAEFLMLMPSITRLIMATSDKDLIPVVRLAQKRGVFAGVVGSDRTASALSDLADEFVTYRQLLEGEAPQPLAISRPVTVPPMRIARGFRRPGEGLSGMSSSTQTMSRNAPPTNVVNTPTTPAQSVISSPVLSSYTHLEDDSSAASRRRRRGGRRRRGSETLAIVGSEPLDTNDEQDLAGQPTFEAPAFSSQTAAPSSNRGARSSESTRPTASSPIARPIVAPLIAPRPFRTRSNDGLSPLAGRPQPVLITPSLPDEPSEPVDVRDAVTTVEASAPIEVQSPLVSSPNATPTANVPSAPRVQLPGERLRRFVAPPVTTQTVPAQGTATAVEAVSASVTPASETIPEDHATAMDDIAPSTAHEGPAIVASAPDDLDPEGSDGADPATAPVGTPRPRRRRGGRAVRASGESGDSEGEPSAEAVAVATIEPVPEPTPIVDAVEASDSTPDGRPRGRRRGSRPRAIA
ncbi:MAG: NYN domain-containing protein [Chloroflexi bacterium]|nr:NYN domain-containing protein [Chloroflexota bacterium]